MYLSHNVQSTQNVYVQNVCVQKYVFYGLKFMNLQVTNIPLEILNTQGNFI